MRQSAKETNCAKKNLRPGTTDRAIPYRTCATVSKHVGAKAFVNPQLGGTVPPPCIMFGRWPAKVFKETSETRIFLIQKFVITVGKVMSFASLSEIKTSPSAANDRG